MNKVILNEKMKIIGMLFFLCSMLLSGCSNESEKYMKLADQYFANGQYDYAAYNYVRVLETDRTNEKAYMNLIDSYIAQEKVNKALDYIEDAEAMFGVQSVSDKRKIVEALIEKEKFKPTPTPTEIPASESASNLPENQDEVTTNLAHLKSFIQSNGSTNGDGDKIIELSDSNCTVGVVYSSEENLFKFGILYSYSDIDVGIMYSWNNWMGDSAIVETYVSSSVNTCCATAVLEISNYYGQDLEFEIYDMGGFHTEGLEENVSTVLNSVFQSGMTGFDLMLSEMGMSLSDIGFTAYLD